MGITRRKKSSNLKNEVWQQATAFQKYMKTICPNINIHERIPKDVVSKFPAQNTGVAMRAT